MPEQRDETDTPDATPTVEAGVVSGSAKPEGVLHQRLLSLDAYRGLIMISLAFGGFGLASAANIARRIGGPSAFWDEVYHQFEHVEWVGCGYWDLIQPSFMFMVGVSMAFSYLKRQNAGDSYGHMLLHAVLRSLVLILLGIFLDSNGQRTTNWSFMNVLTQIGLGYPFLFLLWNRPAWLQGLAAAGLLVGTTLLYQFYPTTGIDLALGNPEVYVSQEWAAKYLSDVPPAWHKNANVGHDLDVELLNLFPRIEPFKANRGGYQTLNFVPSLATMIFGLLAGEWLRRPMGNAVKLAVFVACGLAGISLGLALNEYELVPIVKRIWTPSWALFSTGICVLILAVLYAIIDVANLRAWSYPLVVVGVNSIAMYVMGQLLKPWTRDNIVRHFGPDAYTLGGWLDVPDNPLVKAVAEPIMQSTMVGLFFWLVCWWMYRQKIFIRI